MTELKPCSCIHEQQDEMYGIGMRVHNSREESGFRCTVCGAEKAGERPAAVNVEPETPVGRGKISHFPHKEE